MTNGIAVEIYQYITGMILCSVGIIYFPKKTTI